VVAQWTLSPSTCHLPSRRLCAVVRAIMLSRRRTERANAERTRLAPRGRAASCMTSVETRRRFGDRTKGLFAAVHESVAGPRRKPPWPAGGSAYWGSATLRAPHLLPHSPWNTQGPPSEQALPADAPGAAITASLASKRPKRLHGLPRLASGPMGAPGCPRAPASWRSDPGGRTESLGAIGAPRVSPTPGRRRASPDPSRTARKITPRPLRTADHLVLHPSCGPTFRQQSLCGPTFRQQSLFGGRWCLPVWV
jgi:hypothetical protein